MPSISGLTTFTGGADFSGEWEAVGPIYKEAQIGPTDLGPTDWCLGPIFHLAPQMLDFLSPVVNFNSH